MHAPPSTHPSADVLATFGQGKLDETAAAVVRTHLDGCEPCRRQVTARFGDGILDRLRAARDDKPLPTRTPTGTIGDLGPTAGSSDSSIPAELRDHPQYTIIRELGRGGMGVVYLAQNKLMARLEVLKVMNQALLDRPGAVERFLREIRSAAMLSHPNIATAYTALPVGNLLVFAMEYVDGQDLADAVKARGGPLPIANACYYVQQAALGLQHAFEKGMVHRDIKPQNLMLRRDEKRHVVKVLDFGLAKVMREKSDDTGLTGEGKMLGTPDYIAPEQTLDAAGADIRADIYSLGCTLYFLLAGTPPFKGRSLFEVLQAHQSLDATPLPEVRPDVAPALDAVVRKMMAKDPTQRYQTPIEVAKALGPFVKMPGKESTTIAPTVRAVAAKTAVPPVVPPTTRTKDLSPTLPPEPVQARSKPSASPASKRLWPIVAGGAFALSLLILMGLWVGGVFKVKTKDGVLVVEVTEPDAEVYVDGELVTVTWDNGGKTAEIRLKPGSHQIEVMKDGFTVIGEEVTMSNKGREFLSVRLERDLVVRESPKSDGLSSPFLASRKPGIAELEQVEADLRMLAFSNHRPGPGRNKQRWHAIQELRETTKAIQAGKTGKEILGLLDPVKVDIEALKAVATSTRNKLALEDAQKSLESAMKLVKPEGDHSPVKPNGPEQPVPAPPPAAVSDPEPSPAAVQAQAPEPGGLGFVPLFNGKDLTDWKTHDKQPGNWRVENGVLIGSGPSVTSHLYTNRDNYKNFHLRLEARINEVGESGVYVRTPFGPAHPANAPRWLVGYSAKIDAKRLGGLNLVDGKAALPIARQREPSFLPDQWLTLEVIATGNHIVVKTNGETTVDYTDATQRFKSGHIALQQHTLQTVCEFRKIEIKELPADEVKKAPPPPGRFAANVPPADFGCWSVVGNHLEQTSIKNNVVITFGDTSWIDYDFEVEFLRVKGNDQVCLGFHLDPDKKQGCLFGLSTFRNTAHTVEWWADGKRPAKPQHQMKAALPAGKWHVAKVSIRGEWAACFLDHKRLFNFKLDSVTNGRVGLRTWDSHYRFRNIKVTDPKGKVLLQGLPDL